MAFRVVRLRREARRMAKLEEIFTEKDRTGCGSIHLDQVAEIFRMYEVSLDEAAVARVTSEEGTVAKADFIKLSQDLKLLDFGGPMGQEKRKLATPRRERRVGETDEEGNYEGLSWLCCCPHPRLQGEEKARDRVLVAFTTWDTDGDGFLSWEEFQRIGTNTAMSQEQALRIFQHCDKTGRGKVSLQELRDTVNSRPRPVTGGSRAEASSSNSDCDQHSCEQH